tara:strand:+ start:1075 stop:1911 length:837 start_codon:yes stop_codon:yes gene_type:complete
MAIKIKGKDIIHDNEDITAIGNLELGEEGTDNNHTIFGQINVKSDHNNFEITDDANTGIVMLGALNGQHLAIDHNTIQSRFEDGQSTLYLNNDGGNIKMSDSNFQVLEPQAGECRLHIKGSMPAIELIGNWGSTPYIDFKDDSSDYDMRIIRTSDNTLDVAGGQLTNNAQNVPIYRSGTETNVYHGSPRLVNYGVTFTEVPLIKVYVVPRSMSDGGGPTTCSDSIGEVGDCGSGKDSLGGNINYGYHIMEATTTGFKIKNDNGAYRFDFQWRAVGIKA